MQSRRRSFMHVALRSLLVGVFLVGALIAVGPAQSVLADTFTVNSNGDGHDVTPGNGICETAFGNGTCTLRAAIEEANALGGANTITVPAMTITLTLCHCTRMLSRTSPPTSRSMARAHASTIIQPTATFNAANTRVLDGREQRERDDLRRHVPVTAK